MTPRTISCVILVALGAGLAAQTADRDRAEAETRRVDDRMRALQNEADGLAGQARTLLGDLRQLEIDREIQNERVGQAQAAVAQGQAAVASTTERLAALEGSSVRGIHSGTVSFADPFTGFGNLVVIDHGADAYSLYGYLGAMSVSRGDPVDSGTEIARVEAAPAGPAGLYLEIRIDGRSVDPVEWLRPR